LYCYSNANKEGEERVRRTMLRVHPSIESSYVFMPNSASFLFITKRVCGKHDATNRDDDGDDDDASSVVLNRGMGGFLKQVLVADGRHAFLCSSMQCKQRRKLSRLFLTKREEERSCEEEWCYEQKTCLR